MPLIGPNNGWLFYPEQVSTTLACGAATGTTFLALPQGGDVLMIQNEGGATAFITFSAIAAGTAVTAGGAVNAAADGGMPILAGGIYMIRADPGLVNYIAGITAAGTTTLRITRGSGS